MKKQFSIRCWLLVLLGATFTSCSLDNDMEAYKIGTVVTKTTSDTGSSEETGEEEELEVNN